MNTDPQARFHRMAALHAALIWLLRCHCDLRQIEAAEAQAQMRIATLRIMLEGCYALARSSATLADLREAVSAVGEDLALAEGALRVEVAFRADLRDEIAARYAVARILLAAALAQGHLSTVERAAIRRPADAMTHDWPPLRPPLPAA